MVPVLLLGRARTLGAEGERWLRELPAVLDDLARTWGVQLGRPLAGGTAAYVVEAGDDAVVKVELPEGDGFAARVAVLRAADGRGYARLLAHDADRRAFLLERLEPADTGYAEIAATLDEAWRVHVDVELPTGADKARRLAAFVEEHAGGRDVARILELCASRAEAFDRTAAVVVHGDAQSANLLRRSTGEYAFVDPDPFLCETAYDLAVAQRHVRHAAGDDAVQEWHAIERCSTGLECLRIGARELSRQFLDDA